MAPWKRWIVLYPLKGVDITDPDPETAGELMFGDATIISKRHIPSLMRQQILLHGIVAPLEEKYIQQVWDLPWGTEIEYHAYVAVRQNLPSSDGHEFDAYLKKAERRSNEIGGMLALIILAHWRLGQTCALVRQLHSGGGGHARFATKQGGLGFGTTFHHSFSVIPDGPLTFSRKALSALIMFPQFVRFSEAILRGRKQNPDLVNTVREVTVMLSDALQSLSPVTQLLNSITSLEMMLGNDLNNKLLTPRSRGLLGIEHVNDVLMKDAIDARNALLHQGRNDVTEELADWALTHAIACAFRYAEVVWHFDTKTDLLEYLDFLHHGDQLSTGWSEDQRRAFQALLQHDRTQPVYPYIHLTDEERLAL